VVLNAINDAKDGCFGVVFMGILKGLVSFRREIGGLLTQKDMQRELSLLLRVAFELTETLGWSLFLCRILRLLIWLRTLWRISVNGAFCVKWPSFSPDLNPIEKVWNWMKDWIQDHFDDTLISWDELREAVEAAWEALPATYLAEELSKMPARCQAVIDADRMHTRY
jgi:DDE superfamily endonuclease